MNEKERMSIMLSIDPAEYETVELEEEEIFSWFEICGAGWVRDNDPQKPHAQLTSGKCSNGYFNCPEVLKYPNLCEILAKQLVGKVKEEINPDEIDWVIGSAYSAITFSYKIAEIMGKIHGFVEKDSSDPNGKRMIWQRMKIPAGSNVLQIEELITTAGTMREVQRAIEQGNGEPVNFLPVVGTLVHRPPKLPVDYGERKIIALLEKEIWAVEPAECPLCKAGSPRYRPKTHWKELTGKK